MIASTASPGPAAATPRAIHPTEMREILSDGSVIHVRPLRASDAPLELSFLEGLSNTSRRQRFLGQIVPDAGLAQQLTAVDGRDRVAFGAFCYAGAAPRLVGVSRYVREDDPQSCELAVTVADDWQDRGLGGLLLRYLIAHARSHDLRRMRSLDSASNQQMRDLVADFGFASHGDPEDATMVVHTLELH